VQLQWVAADPAAYDPNQQSSSSWAGAQTSAGRTYPLTFDRVYPAGGMPPTTGTFFSPGDLPVRPLLRIYGPAVAPTVTFTIPGATQQRVMFTAGVTIDAGHWIDVDADRRTAYWDSDVSRPAVAALNWSSTTWLYLPARTSITFNMTAGGTNQVSQAMLLWRDGYLS
jgi:hypothetical protein